MVGGSGEIAGFASMGWVNSKLQQASFAPVDMPTYLQTLSDSYETQTNYYSDPLLVKRFSMDSGAMVDMLLDSGMQITPTSATACKIPSYGLRWKVLHTAAEKLGAKTYLETRAEKMVVDSSGKLSAVIATRSDGSTLTVKTRVAIVCTGGATANPDMMMEYFPNYSTYAENCAISSTDGKGLQMLWDIGAAKGTFGLHAHNHTMPLSAKYAGISTVAATDDIAISANVPLLWVNRIGARFGNEAWAYNPQKGGNIIFGQKRVFVVLDQATVDYFVQKGTPIKPWRGAINQPMPNLVKQLADGQALGYVFKGDTIKNLAVNAGWDTGIAAEQIARYNTIVTSKQDNDYYKQVDCLVFKIETAPFYAIEIRPRLLGTFGGIVMSKNYEVLKDDGFPLPGLYAAGDNAAGWFGRVYPDIGGLTSCHNTTSGYSAAMEAIKYIKG